MKMKKKCEQYPGKVHSNLRDLLVDGAKLSKLAYENPENVANAYDRGNREGIFEILTRVMNKPTFIECKNCDAQCYLLRYVPPPVDNLATKPVLVICVRGSSSIMDWICDVKTFPQVNFASDVDVIYRWNYCNYGIRTILYPNTTHHFLIEKFCKFRISDARRAISYVPYTSFELRSII